MSKQRKSMSRSSQAQRRSKAEATLEKLEKRFARFHAENPPRTRVPLALRRGALQALDEGVSSGKLQRACRISWGQLKSWKTAPRLLKPSSHSREAKPEAVRVFSVVDTDPVVQPTPMASDGLELRFGPWSVCVRLTDSNQGE